LAADLDESLVDSPHAPCPPAGQDDSRNLFFVEPHAAGDYNRAGVRTGQDLRPCLNWVP
jgi:hypothetical protein